MKNCRQLIFVPFVFSIALVSGCAKGPSNPGAGPAAAGPSAPAEKMAFNTDAGGKDQSLAGGRLAQMVRQAKDLALKWDQIPTAKTRQEEVEKTANRFLQDSGKSKCSIEALGGKKFVVKSGAKQRFFFKGIDTSAISQDVEDGVNMAFEASLVLPEDAVLATMADVEATLDMEKTKDIIGCDDVSCMSEIAGTLGADYFIAGKVATVIDDFILSARVIDASTSQASGKATIQFKQGDCIVTASKQAAQELIAPK